MSNLTYEIQKIIKMEIHRRKSEASKGSGPSPPDWWPILDSEKIAAACVEQITELLELWAFIPCCHITGMHDPNHFENREYICNNQRATAFERLCKDLGINPVVRSDMDCGWCNEYPHYRKGEGLKLFSKPKKGRPK
jgi:hypothetical protein